MNKSFWPETPASQMHLKEAGDTRTHLPFWQIWSQFSFPMTSEQFTPKRETEVQHIRFANSPRQDVSGQEIRGLVLTCKMRRTQTFVCSVAWIRGSITQTDAFVFTRVIQTGVKLFTEPPRVAVVAATVVRTFPEARLTNTLPWTKSKQGRSLTKLRFNKHAEP